jgi:hypothetical protein
METLLLVTPVTPLQFAPPASFQNQIPPLSAIHVSPLVPSIVRNARGFSLIGKSGTDSDHTFRTGFIVHPVLPGGEIAPAFHPDQVVELIILRDMSVGNAVAKARPFIY